MNDFGSVINNVYATIACCQGCPFFINGYGAINPFILQKIGSSRLNWGNDIIVKVKYTAFKGCNDVEMHIKTNENIQKTFDIKLKYVSQKLTKNDLRDWYYNLDVYLSGATCEGWGMMQQESMCCGRPIIYTNYGGLSEFVNKNNGFEVGYDEVYSERCWGDYGGKWSEFKEDEFIDMMRYCYNNRDQVVYKGKQSSLDASVYTKQQFIKNISKVINLYINV